MNPPRRHGNQPASARREPNGRWSVSLQARRQRWGVKTGSGAAAQDHFALERYQEAAELLERRLERQAESDVSRVLLAACYGHLGRTEDARAAWREALRINPDYSIEHQRQILPYTNPEDFERMVEGLRKAGLKV